MLRLFTMFILFAMFFYFLVLPANVLARCDVADIIYDVDRDRSLNEIRERCDDEIDVKDCSLSHVIRMVQRMKRAGKTEREIKESIYEACGRR